MASEAGFVTDVWCGRQVVADDYGDYEITDDVMRLVAIAYNRGLEDAAKSIEHLGDWCGGHGEPRAPSPSACAKTIRSIVVTKQPVEMSK